MASPQTSPTTDLPSTYVPADHETTLYQRWLDAGYFRADADAVNRGDKQPYAIVIPPPNVTGSLHLGHAFQHTLMDALTRRKRMQGYESLWLPGMDHAGIATQTLVERHLAETEGKSKHDLSREEFVERVWAWKEEYGGRILGQMRRFGCGVDWDRERFTMDEGLSRAVQTIFKRLYDDELIYRAERIINWCPRCRTALSDIEVDHHDDDGELVSIRYGDGDDAIVVATTRAETMLGDTAVAVHPDDERYAHLIGTEVALPLTNRRIPIVADTHVDPDFGTGAVKVTPAHDPNDFEIGRRHDLPMLVIMDERGAITAKGPFEGLDRFEARPAVVAALRAEGRIVAEKRPYVHAVGHCSRCDTVVEPRLSLQWFVDVGPLAAKAAAAVNRGDATDQPVTIVPESLQQRYFDWVDNMHDWCISRQLWWGHRIPVWYGPGGEVVCVGPDDEPPAGEGWTQDPDVLDTWFSSALWPFSTLGWPDEQSADLKAFYPTSVLLTGHDIIFFWVARMMMFGIYAMDETTGGARPLERAVPFETIALTGLVRDQFGKKMSKSRGNTVDPLDWMEAYGADALRFTLARGANPGQDVPIGEEWVQGSRNFCNKLWNATRFAMLNGASVELELPAQEELSAVDRWILGRLESTVTAVNDHYDFYDFADVVDALYHFVWDDFCNWYLELAKTPLARGGAEADATRAVLGHVLDVVLRLLHPLAPFVTEALWTALTGEESVVVAPFPAVDEAHPRWHDPASTATVDRLQGLVTEVRRFRADQGLKPSQKVPARLVGVEGTDLAPYADQVRSLLRLTESGDGFSASASLPVGGLVVELDLAGTVDVAAERKRLEKDLATARKEVELAAAKLGNEAFIAKAPEPVVEKIRVRLSGAEADVARIEGQLAALPAG